jgi:hypothetical protein
LPVRGPNGLNAAAVAKTTYGTGNERGRSLHITSTKGTFMSKVIIRSMAAAAFLAGAGLASAETTSSNSTATSPSPAPAAGASKTDAGKMTLTDAQAKSWVGKPVYSSDGKQIGDVVSFERGVENAVTELRADIGGFLGFGKTRVKLTPQQFKLQTDRVVLSLTQQQAEHLPKVNG